MVEYKTLKSVTFSASNFFDPFDVKMGRNISRKSLKWKLVDQPQQNYLIVILI
jgi:hypothetical protein